MLLYRVRVAAARSPGGTPLWWLSLFAPFREINYQRHIRAERARKVKGTHIHWRAYIIIYILYYVHYRVVYSTPHVIVHVSIILFTLATRITHRVGIPYTAYTAHHVIPRYNIIIMSSRCARTVHVSGSSGKHFFGLIPNTCMHYTCALPVRIHLYIYILSLPVRPDRNSLAYGLRT